MWIWTAHGNNVRPQVHCHFISKKFHLAAYRFIVLCRLLIYHIHSFTHILIEIFVPKARPGLGCKKMGKSTTRGTNLAKYLLGADICIFV